VGINTVIRTLKTLAEASTILCGVPAYTFGPRTDDSCRKLLALLTPFNIGMITSDGRRSYVRALPKDKHLTAKIFTQRIERTNLTLRTRIKRLTRRTICFSRSVELHEKIIGLSLKNTCSTNWSHYQLNIWYS
jgi:insertion element IS1 protein InsB